ncbi:unnamed protein product [Arabis nemorensis]|uniref:NYN domain-containing protein n=1 Tax=Arabis nemorensis TaxID=586526 RepID=A0A565BUA4_9BRAS|nr:unnamed protein product [Arabis nemorensis]
MLVDIVLYALDNPAPSNLLVISKDISEETALFTLLQALDSKGYNILVAQTEEVASAVLHCTESSNRHLKRLFGHIGSTPNKGKKPKHHVVLIPICFRSNLASHGYDGEVSIRAYCEENMSLDITLIRTGDRSTKMLNDILFWALENQKASQNLSQITCMMFCKL